MSCSSVWLFTECISACIALWPCTTKFVGMLYFGDSYRKGVTDMDAIGIIAGASDFFISIDFNRANTIFSFNIDLFDTCYFSK